MREHRQEARRKVKEWAKIILPEGGAALNCTIVDISDTGAQLAVGSSSVPAIFILYRKSDRTLREATVMRKSTGAIGVKLGPPLDPQGERAKGLLAAHTAVS